MIRIEKMTKTYGDRVLLKDISYHFPQGEKIALIGANGQGKTTLLNLMIHPEEADTGQVIQPKDMRLGYLPQSPNPTPRDTLLQECMAGHEQLMKTQERLDACLLEMGQNYNEKIHETYESLMYDFEQLQGYEWEGQSKKILLGLGFTEENFQDSPKSFSGGWRMRLELARVLIKKPDFMILDEPTNHLDLPTIEWLESYLQDYKGTLLFVSHDKAFLNALATRILYLNLGTLTPYAGNFDDFLEQKDQDAETIAATAKKIEKQKAHMQKFVDRFGAKATKAAQAASRKKMIERLNSVLHDLPQESMGKRIRMPDLDVPATGRDVVKTSHLVYGYDKAHPLNKGLNLLIQKQEKVAIVGANGKGKSTLLKTIVGLLDPLSGAITLGHNVSWGFFAQDAADQMDKNATVLEVIQQENLGETEQTLRRLLGAFLFSGQDAFKKVSVLSGGERTRLALATLMAKKRNLILLDEPTNHLDMTTSSLLAEIIAEYKGAVILVSHDRDFLMSSVQRVVEI